MAVEEKFNINLNQNLWGLVTAYVGLGAAEYYKLKWLLLFSLVVAAALSLSVVITFGFYTYNYCRRKLE